MAVLELFDPHNRSDQAGTALETLGDLDKDRFARAGFASGLTATLAGLHNQAGLELPPAWRAYAEEQLAAVTARQDHFAHLLPIVLSALDGAGVPALPVKGAVLATQVWPVAGWRPMSDIDVVVAPADRARAGAALIAAGLVQTDTSDWEDTFLAWGDGRVGRIDGESPDHNGKVELHPGWVERLHNYLVDDGGLLLGEARPGRVANEAALCLSPAALALHVVGHLSATVVRAEVRPLNVVDAVLCLRRLVPNCAGLDPREEFAELAGRVDPRLVEPGMWLVQQHRPELVAARSTARLSARARSRLAGASRASVLRDPNRRTSLGWRMAFADTGAQRRAVLRQWMVPPTADLRRAGAGGSLRLQWSRLARITGRVR